MFAMRHQHIFGQFPNTQNIRNEEQSLISHPSSISSVYVYLYDIIKMKKTTLL